MTVRRIETLMSRAAYEIRAEGEVPRRDFEDFQGVTFTINPAGSTIHVALADGAELLGILDALRREGLVLAEVRRKPNYGPSAHEPDGSSNTW